ncbi:MAG: 50S ribosomal protein L10 [Ignavibacteriota bacterium]
MTRDEKVQAISELSEIVGSASAFYFTDYQGLTVAKATELRNQFRKAGVQYKISKNTLLRRALADKGLLTDQISASMKGQTAVAYGFEDPAAPARVLKEFLEKNNTEKPALKLAYLDGTIYDSTQLKTIAALPTKKDIMASIVGSIHAPISGIVGVLGALQRDIVYIMDAIEKKKGEAVAA